MPTIISGLIDFFERSDGLPSMLYNIAQGFLTVLIPLGIVIFTDIYQKRKQDKEFANLDIHIIMQEIIRVKSLIIYIIMISLPYIFWETSSGTARLFEFIVSVTGICFLGAILFNVYAWIQGHAFKFRFEYLKNLKKQDDIKIAWRSVWETKNISVDREKELFEIFSVTVDRFLKNPENTAIAGRLINDFQVFLDNRQITSLVVNQDTFCKILQWHFHIWQAAGTKPDEYTGNILEIRGILDDIVGKIMDRALKGNEAFYLFETLKKHTGATRNESYTRGGKEHGYFPSIFDVFWFKFMDNIDKSQEKDRIWEEYFPSAWKITRANVEKGDSEIKYIEYFLFKWLAHNILDLNSNNSGKIGMIVSNMFPEVNPITWLRILLFVLLPYEDIRAKIEVKWKTGLIALKSRASWGANITLDEIRKKESENTIQLALLLFREYFKKEKLSEYIAQLEKMGALEENVSEKHRIELLNLFKEMLKFPAVSA